mmetsp:Transcript_15494/g.24079  ORF Transcript_15494/g.24079 Transcript_15494/m.24079 type:complete len:268 (-) Transcript_15494:21-824(-)
MQSSKLTAGDNDPSIATIDTPYEREENKRQQHHANSADAVVMTWEPNMSRVIRDRMFEASSSTQFGLKRPFIVAIAGIPGSGKSTSATVISEILSDEHGISNVVVPMDGYHFPLEDLRSFDNSADAIYRRGAPDTFDASSLRNDLRRIRDGNEDSILIPGFDHALGDPQLDQYEFSRGEHQIVICEGLYLLHDKDGWEGTSCLFDFRVFVEADIDLCVNRLKERNKCIPGYTPEEINTRCDRVDRANAHTVQASRKNADVAVNSIAM